MKNKIFLRNKYYLALVAVILFGCKQDENLIIPSEIIIGTLNSEIQTIDINPDAVIFKEYANVIYSMDINSDGTNDINFSVFNNFNMAGQVLVESELRISTLNDLSFVNSDSIYSEKYYYNDSLISQSSIDSLFPKILSVGDTISFQDKWRNGSFRILSSGWGCCPPSGIHWYYGNWKDLDNRYIGIRYQDQLGWIKIGIPRNMSIKVYEYALKNN